MRAMSVSVVFLQLGSVLIPVICLPQGAVGTKSEGHDELIMPFTDPGIAGLSPSWTVQQKN